MQVISETHEFDMLPLGPVTFVFYEEDQEGFEGIIAAHCLELDIGGQGATREEATQDLEDAIKTYVLHHVENNLPMELRRATPRLANLKDRVTKQLFVVRVRARQHRRQVVFTQPPPKLVPSPWGLSPC